MLCNSSSTLSAFRVRPVVPARRGCVSQATAVVTIEDSIALQKEAQARAKAWLAQEAAEAASRPMVKVTLRNAKVALGENWKLWGEAPEFGRVIEVAPYMTTSDGDTWTYEGRVRPGTHHVKAVLHRMDRSYWTEGPEATIEVSKEMGPTDVIEVNMSL